MNFIKTAIRSLKRNLAYTLVNILGLSFALAIFIILALYIQFESSFDNFNQHANCIYRIEQMMKDGNTYKHLIGCPSPTWKGLKDEFPEVELSIRFSYWKHPIETPSGNEYEIKVIRTDNDFLKIFSYQLIQGNQKNALAEPFSMILTESLSNALFGRTNPIGKTLEDDGVTYKITGLMKDPPNNSHLDFNALQSINTLTILDGGDSPFTSWGDNWVSCYVKLDPNHHINSFNAKLRNILKKLWHEGTENQLFARPVDEIHLYSGNSGDYAVTGSITNIYILSTLALFILIMAGVNFTNLSLAYSSKRMKEFGLRKIIGANKNMLIRQFLSESVLMVLFSLLLAFVIVNTFLPWFNQIVNRELFFKQIFDIEFLAFILSVSLILGLLSGIYPAFVIAHSNFKSGIGNKIGKSTLRKLSVGFQFIISACFIIGAIGIYQQVSYLKNKDLGFNAENMIRINVHGAKKQDIKYFREQIIQNPDVFAATIHDFPIESGSDFTWASWEGANEKEYIRMNNNHSDHYFVDTYGLELIEGEGFIGPQKGTAVEGNQGIINETAQLQMRLDKPIGIKMKYWNDYRGDVEGNRITIVGVVKDFHFKSARNDITPMIIRLYNEKMTGWSVSAKISQNNTAQTIEFFSHTFSQVFPELVFKYEFVEQGISNLYLEEMKLSEVVLLLALLAIIIACLGVYGLISFSTISRTKEIGIRRVLGANPFSIYYLFTKEFFALIIAANIIAWSISYYSLNEWLDTFSYSMSFSIIPYFIALSSIIVFAILSMVYQISKTIKANPVNSLKYE